MFQAHDNASCLSCPLIFIAFNISYSFPLFFFLLYILF